ncbi:hypothetical protein CNMCM5623_003529 [Aspergillus felis]|uniref:Uncharacterized protein n=1 Tax=Aspergillus felis TaxID=1287682 RepID=A0A8H6QF09_9EURO|nr:hypothetical protein CNMCM5623_003529 [Aspergillus felis]
MASAYAVYFAIEAPNCAGCESTRPLAGNVFAFSNLPDRRVLLFWLLELASAVSFVFWLIVASSVSKYPITLNFRPLGHINAARASNSSADSISASMPEYSSSAFPAKPFSKLLFVDVWFSLGLTVAVDALAVVATFNRALIKRFHYAVSQRMMFLASAVSYALFSWSNDNTTFVSRHLVETLGLAFALYMLFGLALDMFEKRMSSSGLPSGWGTLQEYSDKLSRSDTSWSRAVFLTISVGGVGLFLTMFISPPWSTFVPVVHIMFEVVLLSLMKATRTPRFLVLCSPPFFATICVHWGLAQVSTNPRLAIHPWTFSILGLVGRFLLDANLMSILRPRSELQWARKNVLISTRRLLDIYVGMILLEDMGVKVITYVKPIMMVTIFGLAFTGFVTAAAYSIAVR